MVQAVLMFRLCEGYVTAGFWAGITVGRFVLTHAARPIGEKIYVFGLVVGVIAFQLMAWLIPNVSRVFFLTYCKWSLVLLINEPRRRYTYAFDIKADLEILLQIIGDSGEPTNR